MIVDPRDSKMLVPSYVQGCAVEHRILVIESKGGNTGAAAGSRATRFTVAATPQLTVGCARSVARKYTLRQPMALRHAKKWRRRRREAGKGQACINLPSDLMFSKIQRHLFSHDFASESVQKDPFVYKNPEKFVYVRQFSLFPAQAQSKARVVS